MLSGEAKSARLDFRSRLSDSCSRGELVSKVVSLFSTGCRIFVAGRLLISRDCTGVKAGLKFAVVDNRS